MAIDTAEKRKSAASVGGVPWIPGVTPNASKPIAWRQQVGWGYSGIAAGSPAAEAGGLVCGTPSMTTRVAGAPSLHLRVTGKPTITTRVVGTPALKRCC